MSINVTLAREEGGDLFPLPKQGEVFVCKREAIFFQSASKKLVCKGMGLFLMSSCRFVFIAQKDKNREDFGSFEVLNLFFSSFFFFDSTSPAHCNNRRYEIIPNFVPRSLLVPLILKCFNSPFLDATIWSWT